MKSVLITRDQANAAKKRGLDPFQHLQEKFKQEHGLEFTVDQFNDKSLFDWARGTNADVFKVTYKGETK